MGKFQRLTIVEQVSGGVMVGAPNGERRAFLPGRGVEHQLFVSDEVEVFIYGGRHGEWLASTILPSAQVGHFALMRCVDVAEHGAYFDWGLPRDLFVPHGMLHEPVRLGDEAVVIVDLDLDGRLYGATKLRDFLEDSRGQLDEGQEVELLVYGYNLLGTLVIVDGRFGGLLYRRDTFKPANIGDRLRGWVQVVRGDGRVDVTIHRAGRAGTDDAVTVVWQALLDGDGFLPLTDKSDPGAIRKRLQLSKKAFKKAVGSLYKARKITIEARGICVID
ncbi:MAG: S1-like domain-containing RNA-binding protein [Myxococcota bacterium]